MALKDACAAAILTRLMKTVETDATVARVYGACS